MFHPMYAGVRHWYAMRREIKAYVGDVCGEPEQKEQICLDVHERLDDLRRVPATGWSAFIEVIYVHNATHCLLSVLFWSLRLRLTMMRRSARLNQCVWYGESGMKINMKMAQVQHRAPMIRNSYFQLGKPVKSVRKVYR